MSRKLPQVIVTLICIVLFLMLNVETSAKNQSTVVRVGYTLQKGYQEEMENGYKQGCGYEYLQQIAYQTGWKYEYVYGTFTELYEKLRVGEIDLLGNVNYSEERAEQVLYSSLPEGTASYYLYVQDELWEIDPGNEKEINTLVLGVTEKSYSEKVLTSWLSQKGYKPEIKRYRGNDWIQEAFESGEINSFVMAEHRASGMEVAPVLELGKGEYYYAVSNARPDLLSELNAAMDRLQRYTPGFNEKIRAAYVSASPVDKKLSRSERLWLESRDYTIRLGFLRGNMPYIDQLDNGSLEGILPEVIYVLERDFGIHIELTAFDRTDAIMEAFEAGDLDAIAPLYRDFWLGEYYERMNTEAFYSSELLMVQRAGARQDSVGTLAYADNSAAQIAMIRKLYPDSPTIGYANHRQCLEALLSGEVDTIFATPLMLNLLMRDAYVSKLVITQLPYSVEICLGIPYGETTLLNIVNKAIRIASDRMHGTALAESAYVDQSKYLETLLADNAIWLVPVLLLILLLLTIFLLYYRYILRSLKYMRGWNRVLHDQAFRDEMTLVGNRAAYLEQEKVLGERIRAGEAFDLAILVVDVNNLKWVNDNMGHEAGDQLIKNTSTRLSVLFGQNHVYRMGGDEFAVLLSDDDFKIRFDKLKELVDGCLTRIPTLEEIENGHFSAAAGLAEYKNGIDHDMQEIYSRADRAMYEQKRSMRHRT